VHRVTYEEKLSELGYVFDPVDLDNGRFLQAVRTGDLIFTSGQVPLWRGKAIKGKVGAGIGMEEAREAARLCTLNGLRAVACLVGDLSEVVRIVKVLGMVNVGPEFNETPAVIDACSELLVDVFGSAGRHARSAVGMTIPLNFAVEIELIVEVRPDAGRDFRDLPP
jgi:enamine deaminase RidA (YjgF/YER057c/UK114 family)